MVENVLVDAFLVLLTLIASVSGQDVYAGCFEDPDNQLMPDFSIDMKDINNPRRCQNICRQFHFNYAGLKNGFLCLCSKEGPSCEQKRRERECDKNCPNSKEICGGASHISVYSVPEHLPIFTDFRRSWTYIGCYGDSETRLFNDLKIDFSEINHPKKCTYVCRELGFLYAGLENGNECFCSNERPTENNRKTDDECNMLCPHSDQKCGGALSLAVYSRSEGIGSQFTEDEVDPTLMGCYKDSGNRLLSDFRINLDHNNSPKRCVYICRKLGFSYAGMETGKECFCGNTRPSEVKKMDESECNITCPNSAEICGGPWRLSVYPASEFIADSPDEYNMGDHLGCFMDIRERIMPDLRMDLPDINSPNKCIYVCKKLGFPFAGVESRNECFCSRKQPSKQLSRREENCNTDCPQTLENCGGQWHIRAYYTFGLGGDKINNGTYLGCFENSEKLVIPDFQIDFREIDSPEKCIYVCKEFGFLSASMKNGQECFCSQYVSREKRLQDVNQCQTRCHRSKRSCIGPSKQSPSTISPLKDKDVSVNKKVNTTLLGCYDEVGNKLLSDFRIQLSDNIHKECVNICSQRGFKFAGIEDETDCFCGNQGPKIEKKMGERDCLSSCTSSENKCGLSWRLTVYSTEL